MNSQMVSSNMADVVVAVSGAGRSLQNLIDQQSAFGNYRIVGVIASSAKCAAVQIAERSGIEVYVGDFDGDMKNSKSDGLYRWLKSRSVEWIVLAGFLKLMPIYDEWRERMINIHPSLLPKYGGPGYYGIRVHRSVIDQGDSYSGASIHFVNEAYDDGQLIAQSRVPVLATDNAETLASRVFEVECKLYPIVLSELIAGTLPLDRAETKIYEF